MIVYFIHFGQIRHGKIVSESKAFVTVAVDFTMHRSILLRKDECFESIELLIENLKSEYGI